MKLRISTLSLLIAGVLLSCKSENKDSEIQTAWNAKVQSEKELATISGIVSDGTITLTGACPDESCRKSAEREAKELDGVKKVVNNIQISRVDVADDQSLRTATQGAISRYDGVQADVNEGVITLRGTVKNKEKLQQLMTDLNALHPKRIDNQLATKD